MAKGKEIAVSEGTPTKGYLWLSLGLLLSGLSSLLERFAGNASVPASVLGFCDGLAVGAFAAAVFTRVSGVRQRA